MTVHTGEDRSLGELFADLSTQLSTLVRKEIDLARHEVARSASRIGRAAALVAAGGLLAYAGVIVVLIGVAGLLASAGLPEWMALLLVGGVVIAIGAFLAARYLREIRQTSIVPERTVETIEDNVRWAKEQTE